MSRGLVEGDLVAARSDGGGSHKDQSRQHRGHEQRQVRDPSYDEELGRVPRAPVGVCRRPRGVEQQALIGEFLHALEVREGDHHEGWQEEEGHHGGSALCKARQRVPLEVKHRLDG